MSVPSLGEELIALRGGGVERNGKPWKFTSSKVDTPATSTIAVEKSFANEIVAFVLREHDWLSKIGHFNVFASGTYPITQICLGRLSGGIFPETGKVHAAAGAVVAQELGLKVTGADGREIDWSGDGRIPLLVIAWPDLHQQLLELINGKA